MNILSLLALHFFYSALILDSTPHVRAFYTQHEDDEIEARQKNMKILSCCCIKFYIRQQSYRSPTARCKLYIFLFSPRTVKERRSLVFCSVLCVFLLCAVGRGWKCSRVERVFCESFPSDCVLCRRRLFVGNSFAEIFSLIFSFFLVSSLLCIMRFV